MQKVLILFSLLVLITACTDYFDSKEDLVVMGLKPVYGDVASLQSIRVSDSVAMVNPGKIVYLSPLLFVTEINQGIHVIDNSDPYQPVKEAFIFIPYTRDLAVQNNIIYADNGQDLISLRYYGPDSIRVIDRKEKVFDQLPAFPADYSGYFECIDESKGVVVDWQYIQLTNPECRTF